MIDGWLAGLLDRVEEVARGEEFSDGDRRRGESRVDVAMDVDV